MRKALGIAAVLVLGLFGSKMLLAADSAAKTTMHGELLDLVCYMTAPEGKGEGPDHASCAVKCVKGGAPMGFKAEDGKVYLVLAAHGQDKAFDEAKEYCGKQVEVVGTHTVRGGMDVLVLDTAKVL